MAAAVAAGGGAAGLVAEAAQDQLGLGFHHLGGRGAEEGDRLVDAVQTVGLAPAAAAQGVTSYGGGSLVIDEPRRTLTVRGAPVQLTPTEWGILVTLATVPGRVYSRFELINKVRGYEFEGYERTVDSHVKNLRRKIEEDPANPVIILTVLGGVYRLGVARDD